MSMERCDVLVVGGGPAGSTVAWQLGQRGFDVVVLDKRCFPRDKVCAGWITPAVVDELQIDLEDYARKHVLQAITGFRVGVIGELKEVEIHYPTAVSYGIRRYEFDNYLLQRTQTRIDEGEGLQSLSRTNGVWEVNGRLQAPLLVGAGGHFCPVAQSLGANFGKSESTVTAQEIEFEMTPKQMAQCGVEAHTPELFFCSDLLGYGWCFRKGNTLNIGLGREDNHKLSAHVEAFYKFLQERGNVPRDIPQRYKGHAYILFEHGNRPFIAEGVLLVGDALGLAYTQSGEGIRPAVESGILAAEVIGDASGDYSVDKLTPYANAVRKRFGKRKYKAWHNILPSGIHQAIGRQLITNNWFSKHVLLDQWFLHLQQPPLISTEM